MTGPHDRFFRYLFSPPSRAEALLRHNLPAELTTEVDWSSLRRESGTLVDWQRETRQDLLFSARCLHSSEYRVDDLAIQSERVVRARSGPPLVPLGLLVLSFAGTEELAQRLPHWRELFAQVHAATHGAQALYRVVRYLHQLGDEQAHAALPGRYPPLRCAGRPRAVAERCWTARADLAGSGGDRAAEEQDVDRLFQRSRIGLATCRPLATFSPR